MLAGSLLSIEKEIHVCMYSTPGSTSVIYPLHDLSLQLLYILSSTEILVIGVVAESILYTRVHLYCHEFMLIVYNNYNNIIMVSTVCILTYWCIPCYIHVYSFRGKHCIIINSYKYYSLAVQDFSSCGSSYGQLYNYIRFYSRLFLGAIELPAHSFSFIIHCYAYLHTEV